MKLLSYTISTFIFLAKDGFIHSSAVENTNLQGKRCSAKYCKPTDSQVHNVKRCCCLICDHESAYGWENWGVHFTIFPCAHSVGFRTTFQFFVHRYLNPSQKHCLTQNYRKPFPNRLHFLQRPRWLTIKTAANVLAFIDIIYTDEKLSFATSDYWIFEIIWNQYGRM